MYGRIVAITPSGATKKLSQAPLPHDSDSNDSNAADNPAEVVDLPVVPRKCQVRSAEKNVKRVDNLTTNTNSIVKTENIFVKTEKMATIKKNDASSVKTSKLASDVKESQVVSAKRPISEVKSKKLLNPEVTGAKVAKTLKKHDFGSGGSKKAISGDNKAEIIQVFKKEKTDDVSGDVATLPTTVTPKGKKFGNHNIKYLFAKSRHILSS